MSKLTKFLEENKCKLVSKNDYSSYYLFNDVKIRVSNHIGDITKQDFNILIPHNNRKQYIISINCQLFIYNSFTDLKSFLNHWFIIIGSITDQQEFLLKKNDPLKKQNIELKLKIAQLESSVKKDSIPAVYASDLTKGQRKQVNLFLLSNKRKKQL